MPNSVANALSTRRITFIGLAAMLIALARRDARSTKVFSVSFPRAVTLVLSNAEMEFAGLTAAGMYEASCTGRRLKRELADHPIRVICTMWSHANETAAVIARECGVRLEFFSWAEAGPDEFRAGIKALRREDPYPPLIIVNGSGLIDSLLGASYRGNCAFELATA